MPILRYPPKLVEKWVKCRKRLDRLEVSNGSSCPTRAGTVLVLRILSLVAGSSLNLQPMRGLSWRPGDRNPQDITFQHCRRALAHAGPWQGNRTIEPLNNAVQAGSAFFCALDAAGHFGPNHHLIIVEDDLNLLWRHTGQASLNQIIAVSLRKG